MDQQIRRTDQLRPRYDRCIRLFESDDNWCVSWYLPVTLSGSCLGAAPGTAVALWVIGMIARILRAAVAASTLSCALAASGCAMPGGPVSPESVATDANTLADGANYCIDEVNRYRTGAGLQPLARSSRIDEFSSDAAKVDGEAHVVHSYFRATNGGNGTARAENQIPWWKATQYGSVRAIVKQGLSQMWAEGSGGSHYENMKGAYTEMGCGIFISNGEVTVSQDFK